MPFICLQQPANCTDLCSNQKKKKKRGKAMLRFATLRNCLNKRLLSSTSLDRSFSQHPLVQVSDEIKQALADKKPVVSLESTIISHGLPYPENIAMAKEVEAIVRANGCVPATIGFINGVPKVGLDDQDLSILADTTNKVYKVSRRDIPYIISNKLSGGTTIASTMILSNMVGIDVFATGGLGGVHKNGEFTMDISADLDELSKTSTAVVCSGPKSILDIGRTLEYLETKGVPVTTYNDNGQLSNVPGFYIRDSGYKSPFLINELKQAADMIYNGKDLMQLANGYVFCIPPPVEHALDESEINSIILQSQELADSLGISGKDTTPFLLGKINELTNGKSVRCNVQFVKNNAKVGSVIAKELSSLRNNNDNTSHLNPIVSHNILPPRPSTIQKSTQREYKFKKAVIGSIAVDSICKISKDYKIKDSNPGTITQSLGGVGFNIALACQSSSFSSNESHETLFISAINSNDQSGKLILNNLKDMGISDTGLYRSTDHNTGQYTSIHTDNHGELVVAVADMSIFNHIPTKFVLEKLTQYKSDLTHVLIDSNINTDLMDQILQFCHANGICALYEPTSAVKASKLSQLQLEVYPNNQLQLITPTINELDTIYESFQESEKFTGYGINSWFSILDSLNIDSRFRSKLDSLSNSNKLIKSYLSSGTFQKAFQLLPYFPAIVLKEGKNGVVIFQIVSKVNEMYENYDNYSNRFISDKTTKFSPEWTILNKGKHDIGLLIQHFAIPEEIPIDQVANVTGAGDSMVGYLLHALSENKEPSTTQGLGLLDDFSKQGIVKRNEIINTAQKIAGTSIVCNQAVNVNGIKKLLESMV